MKMRYDEETDAAYLYLAEEQINVAETKELADSIFADYGQDGQLLGIEILGAKDALPAKTLQLLRSRVG